ncbi:MAG: hypothetical protein ACLVHV_09380 [Oscillospiraceae bacterium]
MVRRRRPGMRKEAQPETAGQDFGSPLMGRRPLCFPSRGISSERPRPVETGPLGGGLPAADGGGGAPSAPSVPVAEDSPEHRHYSRGRREAASGTRCPQKSRQTVRRESDLCALSLARMLGAPT